MEIQEEVVVRRVLIDPLVSEACPEERRRRVGREEAARCREIALEAVRAPKLVQRGSIGRAIGWT